MLVLRADRDMSQPERLVVEQLRAYTGAGIAVSGCYIPNRRGRAYEADLIVLTPACAAVVEVKGILGRAGGVLNCSVNDRWSLSGTAGDPVHVRNSDTNPLDQVGERMFDFKRVAEEAAGTDMFVAGLVVVVPPPGASVTLTPGPMPTGRSVLLGAAELTNWVTFTKSRQETPWTAELAHAVLSSLGISEIDVPDLLDAGFALADDTAPAVPIPISAAASWAPPSTLNTPDHVIDLDEQIRPDLGRRDGDIDPPLADYQVLTAPANLNHNRRPMRAAMICAAAALVLGSTGWYLATIAAAPSGEPETSVTDHTPTAEPPPPDPTWQFSPKPPPACFPFQTGC